MQVKIVNRHIKLNDDQIEYVCGKVNGLTTYSEALSDESTEARIDVETNSNKTSNKNITVEVTINVPHSVVRAEVYATTVEEGIDLAIEKLKKQIERYKTKRNRRDKSGKWIPSSTLEEISSENMGTEVPVIAKRKNFVALSPMHEEEAVEQLELLGHSFYAFRNIDNDRFSVIYKRDDGKYGVIDFPEKN